MPQKRYSPAEIKKRRHEEYSRLIKIWCEQLETRLSELGWPNPSPRLKEYCIDHLSELDLLRRGLDPDKYRTFKGRIALEIRCEGKGHSLARVYPTHPLPVLVPTIATLPYGQGRSKEARAQRWQNPNNRKMREMEPWATNAIRDPWIEDWLDDTEIKFFKQDMQERRFTGEEMEYRMKMANVILIRGLTVLRDKHRVIERYNPTLDPVIQPAWEFMCRCGTRTIATAVVMDALDRHAADLFV